MNFSIKNTLRLCVLFFACSFLHGAETSEENPYPIKYHFYEDENCIKVKIVFPVGTNANYTLYKIESPDPKGVAVKIKNDQLKGLETFFQLVDIEIYAVPSQEGGATFEIIEHLERKPDDRSILEDKFKSTTTIVVKTDKPMDFREDVPPKLTGIRNSPHMKYLRFFTKP